MKFKFFVVLILLYFQFSAFGQQIQEKNWAVKLNSTALADGFSFPSVQFGVERKINAAFSLQVEAGYQAYNLNRNNADTISVDNAGFRLTGEGRFYIFNYLKKDKSQAHKSDGLYTGIQVFYRKNSYNERLEYYRYEESTVKILDDYGIKKEVYGINLTLGYQLPFKNFILEPYTYIGVLDRKIKNFNRAYDEKLGHDLFDDSHPFIRINDKEEESGTGMNFSFGLRVGYKF